MSDFAQPHNPEYQVQHMTEDFETWKTIETHHDLKPAKTHAQNYSKANPETEVQIVKTHSFNY